MLALAAVLWFALLGHRDLADPDEGRYADVARAIVATGDWVTMRLNGYEYFAKPPLQFWATAASFRLLGESSGAARLSVAAFGLLGVLWIGFVGRALYGAAAGFHATVVLMSSLMYAALAHILTPNMSVTVFMSFGLGALLLAQVRRDDSAHVRRWMLLGWASLALAVLSKGLMGLVLPGAAVFFYMLWQRDWAILRHLHLGAGLLVFLAVCGPWFVAVTLANPEFPQIFFLHEHFERYTTDVHRRDQPLWYFVPVLALGALPWLVSTVQALARPRFAWWPDSGNGFDPDRLLWTYAVLIFAFFSLGSSKLPSYLLPLFPALALLIGRRLAAGQGVRGDAVSAAVLGATLVVAGAVVERFESDSFPAEMVIGYRPWLLAAGIALFAGGVVAFRLRTGWRPAAVLGFSALLGFQLAGWGYHALDRPRSGAQLASAVAPLLDPPTPVYSVGAYDPSVGFYLKRPLRLVVYKVELDFDFDREPRDRIPSAEAFRAQWEVEPGQAIALVRTGHLDDPAFAGMPGRVVYQDPRKTALARR
jgi:4-amino-4-deoxy-L-arabinose transferase-like glycosyltransferase